MSNVLLSEITALIIEGLQLEDITADEIDINAPLFGDGLGLDSIDALEIAVLLERKYGVKITSDDVGNKDIFASISSLVDFVAKNRLK
ncbi:MAG: acyl carrier protein [Gammaproteobacteria bacterium]|nr:acyl carrier protein [Gammaproteobacteria bacterium]